MTLGWVSFRCNWWVSFRCKSTSDGHIELWADGRSLPHVVYDRLSEIDQGAIVENKRLGRVLEVAQHMQARRDSRPHRGFPCSAHCKLIELHDPSN